MIVLWSLSKIKFTCPTCSEEFFIQAKYFKDKNYVTCCNCATDFPDEVVSELKSAVTHLSNAYSKALEDKEQIFEFDFVPVPLEDQYIHRIRQEK